jgi:ribosomal peptide maturation radical SAM protein 1
MRVLLLNMPFVSVSRPSIGLSLLKARLAEEGIECVIGYPSILMAERISLETYMLADERLSHALFLGDWLFAQHSFPDKLDIDTYVNCLKQHSGSEENFNAVMAARPQIGPFLEACFDKYDIASFDVIGFTTTFQQSLGCLALSRMIKDRMPEKIVVFGGGNCEGVMGLELHRSFPWIDYICSGESDHSFPELLKRIAAKKPLAGIPGLIYRDGGVSCIGGPADKIHDMDALPDPDFSDFFDQVNASPLKPKLSPAMLIETARGCWWGAKQHCTFCGLNGDTMAFRAKSADRVLAEIERQVARHGIKHFQAVDNIISHDYFKSLLPVLKERAMGVTFFYEIKSNLRRDQVKMLREAGVLAVQPGIESLSSHVLSLMKKGVTGIQNMALLKWCREYGIEAAWNLLYGFPGETGEDYDTSARYASAIPHLRPPGAVAPIRLDRFSPNFNRAEDFGIVNIRPFALYRYIYPLPPESIANLAYFFEYEHRDGRKPETYLTNMMEQVKVWKENAGGDLRKQYNHQAELMVVDTRPGRPQMMYPFNGIQREIYDYCDEIRSRNAIAEFARQKAQTADGMDEALDVFLGQMEEWQLMVREGSQYLSVAVHTA